MSLLASRSSAETAPASASELVGLELTGPRAGVGLAGGSAARALLSGRGWTATRAALDAAGLALALAMALVWSPESHLGLAARASALVYPLVVIAVFAARGLYRDQLRPLLLDTVWPVVAANSLAAMSVALLAAVTSGGATPVGLVARLWLVGTVAIGAGHCVAIVARRAAQRRGALGRRTLIVGAGSVGLRVARRLDEHPEYGMRAVGFVDADSGAPSTRTGEVPAVGPFDDLPEVVERTRAEHVIFAFSSVPDRELVELARRCEDAGLVVSLVPRLYESINHRAELEYLGGLPIMRLRGVSPTGWRFGAKHLVDRAVAAVTLLALAPTLAAIAAAVKLSSTGPVLFRQRRVGRDGHEFELLKFRTMRGAPVAGERYIPKRGAAPGGVEGIDRRTAVGRFLRRTSLDELPQFLNVVRGDMSLVGPRPERPEYVDMFRRDIERYGDRHRVRSGITGWAQVHGLRGQTSVADRVEWDNYYIANWSVWLDLRIVAMTVVALFRGD